MNYSTALTVYDISFNNYSRLAALNSPFSLTRKGLTNFNLIPGQSLLFYHASTGIEPATNVSKTFVQTNWTTLLNLPRCAVPVVSYIVIYKMQHTIYLSPCGILSDTSWNRYYSIINCNGERLSALTVRLNPYLLTVIIR